jgi:tetratricopeptide (TPR) repeat protein
VKKTRRLASRWKADSDAARAAAVDLLNLDPREWRFYLETHPGCCTAAILDEIHRAADATDLPVRLHELTSLGLEIASRMDDASNHPAVLGRARGRAWRYEAGALEALSRYPDALAACNRAAEFLRTVPALADEEAKVRYIRGTVLTRMGGRDNFARALAEVRAAAQAFGEYADVHMYVKVRLLEGYVLYKSERQSETLELWRNLIAHARAMRDEQTLAALYSNVGAELRKQGDLDRATWYLKAALRLFPRAGMTSQSPRVRLSLARIRAARGDYAKALAELWRVRSEFLELRILTDAEEVLLDIAELLIVLGRHTEARAVCVGLPEKFRNAGMSERELEAVAYLKECAEAGLLEEADVVHVRLFLRDLPQDPARRFTRRRRAAS